ncbi:hypothetical protein DB347_03685 [Opitutaceae bacterium EW11]|nr:hypothetical protein DB347_03685 [Opitutaceae bacterium EW11]
MTTRFELAPARKGLDWQLPIAFSLVPAIVLFAMLEGYGNGFGFSLGVALAAFVGSAVLTMPAARPRTGSARLTDDRLVIECGGMEASIALDELDLSKVTPTGAVDTAELNAVTDPARALEIHRRGGGGTLRISPLEPQAFLQALRAAQAG